METLAKSKLDVFRTYCRFKIILNCCYVLSRIFDLKRNVHAIAYVQCNGSLGTMGSDGIFARR